jgi:membrane protease YdiL (CAAX protease family)
VRAARLRPGTHGLGPRIGATGAAVLLTTAVAIGYELSREGFSLAALPALMLFYGGSTAIIVAFSVWTADEIGLPSLLVLSDATPREQVVRWLALGLGMGVCLAVASVALTRGSEAPLQPWFWRRIQTPIGAALFSARAALLEETFFRLFLIPFLISVTLRMRPVRHRLTLGGGTARAVREPAQARPAMLWIVCVLASLMFGLAHPFNPLGAVLLGPLLAIAYLWGGWESAVTAHFVANAILFAVYY